MTSSSHDHTTAVAALKPLHKEVHEELCSKNIPHFFYVEIGEDDNHINTTSSACSGISDPSDVLYVLNKIYQNKEDLPIWDLLKSVANDVRMYHVAHDMLVHLQKMDPTDDLLNKAKDLLAEKLGRSDARNHDHQEFVDNYQKIRDLASALKEAGVPHFFYIEVAEDDDHITTVCSSYAPKDGISNLMITFVEIYDNDSKLPIWEDLVEISDTVRTYQIRNEFTERLKSLPEELLVGVLASKELGDNAREAIEKILKEKRAENASNNN